MEGREEEVKDESLVKAKMTMEAVEKDALAVAASFHSLVRSLQTDLSQVTSSSVEHMDLYSDVAGQVQASAVEAAATGNRFINSCLRLNEEMKGMNNLAIQIKALKQTVDHFDEQINKFLPHV